jgi:CHAT domain-containing protein
MAKFYDLHLSENMAPSAALKAAQKWLRQSTRAHLIDYARKAGKKADIQSLATRLETDIQRGHSTGLRSASAAKALDTERARLFSGRRFSTLSAGTRSQINDRPFCHPYYWGGFIYTGV